MNYTPGQIISSQVLVNQVFTNVQIGNNIHDLKKH